MATLIELAEKFAKRILSNNYNLEEIISEINNLQYEKNGTKLTQDDVDKLSFDTRQYPHIIWENEDDLYNQVVNRLKAKIL